MRMIQFFFSRFIGMFVFSMMLISCQHASSTSFNASSQAACSDNTYLMKYNCDIERIQDEAENGNPDAQYALGYMYYYGINTIQDQQTASLWIKRAAAQGQPLAQKAWSLMNAGAYFKDLHKAASGQEPIAKRGMTPNEESINVSKMNAVKPTQPIADHLPAYQQTNMGDPRLSKNYQPVTKKSLTKTSENTNAQHFTIQLLGSGRLSDLKDFVDIHQLSGKTQHFKMSMDGKPWYILTYGDYNNSSQAQNALHHLPTSLRSHGAWIKSFATVQKEVQLQKIVS